MVDDFRDAAEQLYGTLLETLQATLKTLSLDELSGWKMLIQKNYDKLLSTMYRSIDKKTLDEIEISTILNVNRELYSSHKALVMAVQELLIPTLSEYMEENRAS